MILYHGTNINFSTIDLSASHKGKDFGKGFYLSDNESQAYDFAVFKSIQLGGTPIVHSFKFDEKYALLRHFELFMFPKIFS